MLKSPMRLASLIPPLDGSRRELPYDGLVLHVSSTPMLRQLRLSRCSAGNETRHSDQAN
jgi:hypothetical protein